MKMQSYHYKNSHFDGNYYTSKTVYILKQSQDILMIILYV